MSPFPGSYVHLMEDKSVSGQTLLVAGDKGKVRQYKPNMRHPEYNIYTTTKAKM